MTGTTSQEIITGDCIDEMQDMGENSVHAVVTDPPYGMAFMSHEHGGLNEWDEFDSPQDYQEWCKSWASECLRILKPGGHLIAFSGSRTYGRLMCGVQEAGFEVRDTITWHYGQGFGAGKSMRATAGMDDEADIEEWTGFRIGLKPSTEFAVLARTPFDSTLAENLLEHGVGALNIDPCRIPSEGDTGRAVTEDSVGGYWNTRATLDGGGGGGHDEGRYPPNTVIDESATDLLNAVAGERPTGSDSETHCSRFFYTSKSSESERSIGGSVENNHSTVKPLELMEWLVTLVTAPRQRVLDSFAGSGTTIMACKRLNREGIGIEKDEEHAELARKRVELAHEVETDFGNAPAGETSDNGQSGLDAFADGGAE